MEEREFTAEIDRYVVLKLVLDEFRGRPKPLGPGLTLAGAERRSAVARTEKRLLQSYFRNWKAPHRGRLKGWREDSPIYALRDGRLVGGVFLVGENEFDADPAWGQLHYAFMDPSTKGQGVYSAIFAEAVSRARRWGLTGLYLNSDRHMLPEVYERWGAVPWRTIEKTHEPRRRKTFKERLIRLLRGRQPTKRS